MRPKGILKCRYIFSSTYPVTPRKEDEHLHNIFSISNDKGTYLFLSSNGTKCHSCKIQNDGSQEANIACIIKYKSIFLPDAGDVLMTV